jgi:hypothetical protein
MINNYNHGSICKFSQFQENTFNGGGVSEGKSKFKVGKIQYKCVLELV